MFEPYIWPLLTVIWCSIALVVTYFMSTTQNHVSKFFPYVSDTGTLPPESCVFSQMFNIVALLMSITVYIRYRQIDIYYDIFRTKLSKKFNDTSFALGLVSSLGVSIVANFQQENLAPVHFLGAGMAFALGAVYFMSQTLYTLLFIKDEVSDITIASKLTMSIRIFLTSLMVIFCFVEIICGARARYVFNGESRLHWTSEHLGYNLHLAAAFSEWGLVISVLIYLCTFVSEFRWLKYGGIVLISSYV